ncbi:cyclic nucleotide-binding-like protein [Kickxella alabastrina]|uniref:cyclic nucleotide-binding-like protein n=1 Tax=Kickxella alabastrina TaxID=61397 RepID=UPI0022211AAA|nr:cyclic nucleotide-binding-like protein [Kickxella alabastrina]KAI7834386.1 cyclic nucleotide-binding-like protein [Kickxella alabastrina]
MEPEKSTLSDRHSEHEAEYVDILSDLREAVYRRRPTDIYQFCATYFNQKGALALLKMHPNILDPVGEGPEAAAGAATATATAATAVTAVASQTRPEANGNQDDSHSCMRQASEHAWTSSGSACGMINPNFSFGSSSNSSSSSFQQQAADDSGMTVDNDADEEARDKFSSLVLLPFAGRRFSVSAESMNPSTEAEYKKKFVPKTEGQKQRIRQALDNNFLFKNMDEDSYRDVHVERGQSVIVQGGVGDYFYIVERGTFDIYKASGGDPVKVAQVADGGSFGELALMYNAPRAATVTATSDATLWALDRITFRSLLMERTSRKRRLYERFLETVPLLKSLEPYERQKIADALESVTFNDGDVIMHQGDPGHDFFLIEQGTVKVYKTDGDGVSREYPALGQGGYFGELALIDNQPRQATLISCGRTKCARMSRDAFNRLLGPVINIIRREAGNYMHIQSLTAKH